MEIKLKFSQFSLILMLIAHKTQNSTNIEKFINPVNKTNEIKIILTAALIDTQYEERKNEYLKVAKILDDYGYSNPYIIEAIKEKSETFLNGLSKNVFYSNVNNSTLRNKGVNEAKSIIEGFKHFDFKDDDMILKITGRYYFSSDAFIRLIEKNPEYDAFVKTDCYDQAFAGCFALRFHYFKDMLENLHYEKMEINMINIEKEIANYLKKISSEKNAKIMYIEKLDIVANIFGKGENKLTYW